MLDFDIDRISEVYFSEKKGGNEDEPLHTLADVADKLGYDYYQMCEFLHQQGAPIHLHVISGKQAKYAHIQNGQYILDYYLVHKYAYDMLALVFNYDNRGNIARVVRHARKFKTRLLDSKENKKMPRIPYMLQANDIVRMIGFNDHSFNRAMWRMMENGDIPAKSELKIVANIEVRFYEPIWDKVTMYLGNKNYGLQEFISSAFVRYLA